LEGRAGGGEDSCSATSRTVVEEVEPVAKPRFSRSFVQLSNDIRVDQVLTKIGLVPFKIQGLEPSRDVHEALGRLRDKSRQTWSLAKQAK
jgi:hypothetical protein